MSRPIHFEIHAENLERAASFYRSVFEWHVELFEGMLDYMMVKTGEESEPGISGGMLKRRGPEPAEMSPVNAYVCTMGVENIDTMVEKVISNGGSIAVPKIAMPKYAWLVYCKDTEGNIFGMIQMDPNAV